MSQSISVKPTEKGTLVVTISPTDEDNTSLSFGDLTNPQWQLMRHDGAVINERTFDNSSMSSLEVVLQGDDLAIFGGSDSGIRYFSFQATYNSTLGSNLPLHDECSFSIERLLGQEDST